MSENAHSSKWYYCYLPNGIANGTTSLLIPLFAKEIGASVAQIGFIAAGTSLASIPAYILWGHLSDRTKRRKPYVILGFLGMALCLFLMGISQGVPDFYASNLLFGFLGAAAAPVATVLLLETAAKEQWPRRLAVFSQIGGVGWVCGLALGAVWLQMEMFGLPLGDSMRALFIVGALLALLSAYNAFRWIKEPVERLERKPHHLLENHFLTVERVKYLPLRMLHFMTLRRREGQTSRFERKLFFYLVCVFFLFTGFTAFYAFFPIFLVDEIGLQSSAIFLVYIAAQATSAISYTRVGKWVQEKGGKKMQIFGSGLRCILFPSVLAIALFDLPPVWTFLAIMILHSLIGLCWAVINVAGSMLVSGLSTEEVRGEAFGAYNAVQGFGSIAGPIAGGIICEVLGYSAGFVAATVFVLLGIIVLLRLRVTASN